MKREKREMILILNVIWDFKLHGDWADQKRAINEVIRSSDKIEI